MPERVSPEQREAERFRWCGYCDADCSTPDAVHAEWCPQVTGVYPVTVEDRCRHCGQAFVEARIDPYACGECGVEFRRGNGGRTEPIKPNRHHHGGARWVAEITERDRKVAEAVLAAVGDALRLEGAQAERERCVKLVENARGIGFADRDVLLDALGGVPDA